MNTQLFLDGEIIKKSNDIIRTRVDIQSVEASRILACLIAQINIHEKEFKDSYSINVSDFLLNSSGRSYSRLKGFCQELLKATAEIEIINDYNGQNEFYGFTFFSKIHYFNGKITASFNPLMKNSLLRLKSHFTEINLFEYLTLSTRPSKRIFEILKSWSKLPECTIKLDELHTMLNTVESQKNNFGLFRKKILEPAHKEIIKKTNFNYEWEPVKKGTGKTSPVIAIRFIFAKKRVLPVAEKKKELELQKESQKKNKMFIAYVKCFQECGAACEGGHQDKEICEMCLKWR